MIRFIVLNDLHIADNPPLGRKDGYCDQIMDKLHGIAQFCRQAEVQTVFCSGDIFHVKRPDRTSHRLVQRLIDMFGSEFRAAGSRVYAIAGNHDLSEQGLFSLEKQPLGVLAKAGALELIDEERGLRVEGSASNQVRMHVFARPYSRFETDPEYFRLTDDELEHAEHNDITMMLAHASLLPVGETRHPNQPVLNIDAIDFGGPVDMLFSGHLHECLGIHDMPQGGIFANLGSLTRVARSADMLDPDFERCFLMVTIPDVGDVKFDPIPIPNMLPPEEVFMDKEIIEGDSELQEFAEHLADALVVEELPIDEVLASLGDDVPPNVLARVKSYLEDVL